ncbi:hypothetical protein AYI68_g8042 [Smittium mucronatum]|uniref:Uncharacterized protein n=1 Tax=Smittium mucronatum TaxID=133383 RepID=A0A1R0GLZ3_9FUNG|nr:hypothetical protein AYI68_g8042 [Smittium mucronatum]
MNNFNQSFRSQKDSGNSPKKQDRDNYKKSRPIEGSVFKQAKHAFLLRDDLEILQSKADNDMLNNFYKNNLKKIKNRTLNSDLAIRTHHRQVTSSIYPQTHDSLQNFNKVKTVAENPMSISLKKNRSISPTVISSFERKNREVSITRAIKELDGYITDHDIELEKKKELYKRFKKMNVI